MITKLLVLTGAVWGTTLAFAGEAPSDPIVTIPATSVVSSLPASTTSTSTSSTTIATAHDALQADISEWDTLEAVNPNTPCQEWFVLAMSAGWPHDPDVLETLGWTMQKETRCQNITAPFDGRPAHDRWNGHDTGLMQVNQIHRNYVEGLFGESWEEAMSDPWKNLHFAWRLWADRENSGKCGWKPWSVECA